MLEQRGDYWLSTNSTLLDFPVIHRFIAEESYWGQGRTADFMQRAIAHSALCFGLYLRTGAGYNQVGFARVISDLTTFAYLSDVFVLAEHRGKGLGKWLITTICEHPDLRDIKRIALITRTPEFYESLSFVINDPLDIRKFMLRVKSAK
ncbi:MAG: GNAT family N-acetyltransferase [Negativicutes bacterium]